ncbi:MAG: hypothetical protein ACTSYJ_03785 [Candidatus Thorarchaeota archaeon]
MLDDADLSDYEYIGTHPYSDGPDKIAIGAQGIRFVLHRTKKRKSYQTVYNLDWEEVISFECTEVNYCEEDKSWPIDEEPVEDLDIIGPAGMAFFFLMPKVPGILQIWSFIPIEDVIQVRKLIEQYTNRSQLPRLAHHGNAAAVRYMLEHCTIRERHQTTWHDWVKTGPLLGKPRKKFRERGPDYVFCEEGLGIDFYGAGEMLEQMSTFWPWRVIENIWLDDYTIIYKWYDDAYVFRQQVWDKDERSALLESAKRALAAYQSSDDTSEFLMIRPVSFPSYFYTTWEKLDPLSSKASRNGYPPVYDFIE